MRRVALASAALAFCLPAQWVGGTSAAVACLTAATGRRLGASARLGVAIVASATRLDSTLSQELPHARAGASHGADNASECSPRLAQMRPSSQPTVHHLKHSDECGTGDAWQAGDDASLYNKLYNKIALYIALQRTQFVPCPM
ncbi:hypothetical protein EMIHUDRAFT_236956 [Emiliania huxleyi CCMP1516]|uniref:Secreted protein n=2 Tax=Emiliania huxleyi TaxID=2903 RepID=A0A0D3JRM7_EMIH1|nr:hypothetical protein EMIHUDRAFT_236956 [Emiliania huxleyi CCMP1516]EOD26162.1 hypothetical protein EMIHUDRAFT_236956 [Emiliania huxleyi CCMP1516]|eukprot:XP_005778591.1 hypothetical protein EMIHUDRAFT_236956 [Emiliania huxleyi CCMP1516]